METEMKEYTDRPQNKALKAIAMLLASTFLHVGVAYSENNGGGLTILPVGSCW